MSNKQTLQENNTRIENNNVSLNAILEVINNLPEASNVKGFYNYQMNLGPIGFTGETNEYGWITNDVTQLCKSELNDLINKMLTEGINQPVAVIENTNGEGDLKSMLLYGFETNYDPETMQNLDFTFHGVANYIGSATGSTMMTYENSVMLAASGIVTDGVWDATVIIVSTTTQRTLTTENTREYTPTGDYNPATKKYVDDAVANIDVSESGYTNIIEIDCTSMSKPDLSISFATDITNATTKTELQNLINTIKTKSNDGARYAPIVKVNFADGHILFDLYTSNLYTSEPTTIEFAVDIVRSVALNTAYIVNLFIRCSGTWTDGTFTITSSTFIRWGQTQVPGATSVLTKTNTTSYTPTKDYHPATKKYVDDAVAGASGGITSESDPIFSASEAAKITSTDTANWNSKVDITAVNNAINTTLSGKSYLTSESDPTVPAWAKAATKPTYTASEVGALPASTVIPTVPTKLSGFTDDLGTSPAHSHSQYLTAHQDISGKQNKVLYGIADPTSDIGAEGDIYVKYV